MFHQQRSNRRSLRRVTDSIDRASGRTADIIVQAAITRYVEAVEAAASISGVVHHQQDRRAITVLPASATATISKKPTIVTMPVTHTIPIHPQLVVIQATQGLAM